MLLPSLFPLMIHKKTPGQSRGQWHMSHRVPEDVALAVPPGLGLTEGTAWILVLPSSQGCSSTASLGLHFHFPFGIFPAMNVTIASQLLGF